MPVLNVGDIQVQVETVKRASPSLNFMDSSGNIFYAKLSRGSCPGTLKVMVDGAIYNTGTYGLYYESGASNKCETVQLEPGCYHVEVLGGRGGDGGNNSGSGGAAVPATYDFTITTATVAYVLRGGNGNAGAMVNDGNIYSGGGGGASGMGSVFVVNDVVTESVGGSGGRGGFGFDDLGNVHEACGGGGGNAGANSDGLVGFAAENWGGNDTYICGGGGGGSASGTGGGGASSSSLTTNPGTAGSGTAGGNGGGFRRLLSRIDGGTGGATISQTCGGHVVYSYGGGGGGAASAKGLLGFIGVKNLAGGNGGSGVSDTSDGYVRIMRFE